MGWVTWAWCCDTLRNRSKLHNVCKPSGCRLLPLLPGPRGFQLPLDDDGPMPRRAWQARPTGLGLGIEPLDQIDRQPDIHLPFRWWLLGLHRCSSQ